MVKSAWAHSVSELAETHGISKLARTSGVSRGVLYNWMEGSPPTADAVLKFAHGLGISATSALVTAGFLSPSEASGSANVSLDLVTDEALLAEVKRRFNR